VEITKNAAAKLRQIRREAYQVQINTVVQACKAAAEGNLAKLQALAKAGIDLGDWDYDKRTPLHLAAENGRLEVVKFIVELGIGLNEKDRWGSTPLNEAIDHPAIYDYLKKKGAVLGKQMILKITSVTEVTND
jgi:hypothetical protein